jgi:hypothetical protein
VSIRMHLRYAVLSDMCARPPIHRHLVPAPHRLSPSSEVTKRSDRRAHRRDGRGRPTTMLSAGSAGNCTAVPHFRALCGATSQYALVLYRAKAG